MEDVHASNDETGTPQPSVPPSTGTTPKHESPVDQARGVANRLLALVTGRNKS